MFGHKKIQTFNDGNNSKNSLPDSISNTKIFHHILLFLDIHVNIGNFQFDDMIDKFFEHDQLGSLIFSNEYEPENQKPNRDLLANKYNHKVSYFYNQPCLKYDKYS